MRSRVLGAVVGALLLTAACSSGDDSVDETTVAPETTTETTAPSTTVAPTTTTTSTTTTTVPPTTQATTTIPSTEPPTTDATIPIDEEVAAFDAVVEAVEQSWRDYTAALMDPTDTTAATLLENTFTTEVLAGWTAILEDYRMNNFRLVENPDLPASYEVGVETVVVDVAAGTATLQVCNVNSFIKVQTMADGTEQVIDDGISRRVEELGLVRVDGTWKVDDAFVPDVSDWLISCE